MSTGRYNYKAGEVSLLMIFLILGLISGIFNKTGLCLFFTLIVVGEHIEKAILKTHDKEDN